ncbi:MAG: methylthioribose-1-phosphate isomerase [Betaproteobacteria bacterium SG8_40]|jgi:methylthioribose-1-phosphate isomerase|nr:MAG: methylthioribose-1-phosphate isomerase [Betaproteobacteria bacterium SG8_40]
MKVGDVNYRSVWRDGDNVGIVDQTRLPYEFGTLRLHTCEEAAHAIKSMKVRGAPLIGAVAAYGVALAMRSDASDGALAAATDRLMRTRPTAVNLRWSLERMRQHLGPLAPEQRGKAAWAEAQGIADEDIELNRAIGRHGLKLIRDAAKPGKTINVLTHCNAGWLATVDYGTALAPIYLAHDEGIAVHVWVDETRPRSQGFLTAWELGSHGVPYTLIADNAGGHLMQKGKVDLVIVGADRVTPDGHVCNKIGTYLKALAAKHNGVPFFAAVPSPTIDWTIADAMGEIPIEERSADEIRYVHGLDDKGKAARIEIGARDMKVANPGFDVTPPELVTGIITELGICAATREGLASIRTNST